MRRAGWIGLPDCLIAAAGCRLPENHGSSFGLRAGGVHHGGVERDDDDDEEPQRSCKLAMAHRKRKQAEADLRDQLTEAEDTIMKCCE